MMEIQSFYEQLVTSSITRAEKKNSEMVALSQTWKLATQQPPSAQITRQTPLQRKTSLATPIRMVLRARFYDPHTAEFISPDPLEYIDGKSLFRGYMSLKEMDPIGSEIRVDDYDNSICEEELTLCHKKAGSIGGVYPGNNERCYQEYLACQEREKKRQGPDGTRDYEEPPSKPFTTGPCKIAYKCFKPAGVIWYHCGIVMSVGGMVYTIDGTGANANNFDWTGQGHDRFNENYHTGTIGEWAEFGIETCECLRKNSVKWNSLVIPRTNFGFNSNTSLGCLQRSCGLARILDMPNVQSYNKTCPPCIEWEEDTSGGACGWYCRKFTDCCDTVKGWNL